MLVFHSIASSSTSNLLLFNKVHGRLEDPTLSELLRELIEECGELPALPKGPGDHFRFLLEDCWWC